MSGINCVVCIVSMNIAVDLAVAIDCFFPSVVCPGPTNLNHTYTNFSEPLNAVIIVVIDRSHSSSNSSTRIYKYR